MRIRNRFLTVALVASAAVSMPLARSAGSAPDGTLPAEKLALIESIEAAQAEAAAGVHGAKELAITAVESVPEPAWLTGIVQSGHAPLPGSLFDIDNQWHEIVNSAHVNVYAGSRRANPEAGLVVVDVTGLDLESAGPGGVYPTPVAAGAVRIIEAAGAKLVLLSATGARFVFDVATRTYL